MYKLCISLSDESAERIAELEQELADTNSQLKGANILVTGYMEERDALKAENKRLRDAIYEYEGETITPIEIVAKALALADGDDPFAMSGIPLGNGEFEPCQVWQHYTKAAKKALGVHGGDT